MTPASPGRTGLSSCCNTDAEHWCERFKGARCSAPVGECACMRVSCGAGNTRACARMPAPVLTDAAASSISAYTVRLMMGCWLHSGAVVYSMTTVGRGIVMQRTMYSTVGREHESVMQACHSHVPLFTGLLTLLFSSQSLPPRTSHRTPTGLRPRSLMTAPRSVIHMHAVTRSAASYSLLTSVSRV